jgi:hypothetical protein
MLIERSRREFEATFEAFLERFLRERLAFSARDAATAVQDFRAFRQTVTESQR